MSVTAKPLINTKFAQSSANDEYTAPGSTRTIIDKMTVTNTDASSRTVSVYIVPSGNTPSDDFLIYSALSVAAGATVELEAMKNHILATGDKINVFASVASKVVIRASGREIT